VSPRLKYSAWPKQLPRLTDEQLRIRDDWMRYWHERLDSGYGRIERFNHGYPARSSDPAMRTLEIGAGRGGQIGFEHVAEDNYYAVELRQEMADAILERFPKVTTVVADAQEHLPFDDGFFDRVLAIHVLEHLPNLPAALGEVHRVLRPGGRFEVVIPCEGGLAYELARQISTARIFQKRYGQSYGWCIRSEHVNIPAEIRAELLRLFDITNDAYFPLRVPLEAVNLVIGLTCTPKPSVGVRST
jgi:SAM-dependent methyltransferase